MEYDVYFGVMMEKVVESAKPQSKGLDSDTAESVEG